jgi:4-hydroxybenzoate decarboxylase subunit C
VFCPGCLVVEGPDHASEPGAAARLAAAPAFAAWPLVVLTDDAARATRSPMNFLWTTFTRFEPAADIHGASTTIVRNHIARTPPIVIDARMKAWYPKELTCDPAVAEAVTRRWREYFPAGVEMGDSEKGHLD